MDIKHQFEGEFIEENEGIWVITLEKPLSITLSVAQQITMFYENGVLTGCNQTMSRCMGLRNPNN